MNLNIALVKPDNSAVYNPDGSAMLASQIVLKRLLNVIPKNVSELSAMASLAVKIESTPSDFTVTELEDKMLKQAISASGALVKAALAE